MHSQWRGLEPDATCFNLERLIVSFETRLGALYLAPLSKLKWQPKVAQTCSIKSCFFIKINKYQTLFMICYLIKKFWMTFFNDVFRFLVINLIPLVIIFIISRHLSYHFLWINSEFRLKIQIHESDKEFGSRIQIKNSNSEIRFRIQNSD